MPAAVQYAYAQPSHYGSGAATTATAGIPPAAYATSYVPLAARIMAGHGAASHYPSAGAQAQVPPYFAAGGSSSVPYPTSVPSYQYSSYPASGAAGAPSAAASQPIPPAHATTYSGSGTGAAITIQSFSSTTYSYSAGGAQTTYSVSSVSTSNKQGGLDVYRSTSTKVRRFNLDDPTFCRSTRTLITLISYFAALWRGWEQYCELQV